MKTILVLPDGSYRDPDCYLAIVREDMKFQSGNVLPKGEIIELEIPVDRMTMGRWKEKGIVFAISPEEFDLIEEPITPKLFCETKEGYIYWPEL